MRKWMIRLLAIGLMVSTLFTGGVTATQATDKEKVIVFAAASLTESLNQIKEIYEKEHPNVEIVYNFDSSGTLKTQIESGAPFDVFISAAQKQMNELDPAKNDQQKGFIDPKTRVDLLENRVVLCVKDGNPAEVKEFGDIAKPSVKLIALGNDDVPVGQYSKEIIERLDIMDQIKDKISYGSNVKEVTTWIKEGVADCGIIYQTDATAAKLAVVATADANLLQTPVIYPMALKKENISDAQKAFYAYLQTEPAIKVFESVGFSQVKR